MKAIGNDDRSTPRGENFEIAGVSINVMRAGKGDPLLFLHPAGGTGAWMPFHALLAEHFDVIAPDHPGFGQSEQLDWVDGMEDLVYYYLDFMDHFDLEKAHVVGSSLGGWLAAELAVHQPSRVRHLVLVDAIGLEIPEHPIEDLFMMTRDETVEALFHDQQIGEELIPADLDIDSQMQLYKDKAAFARLAWSPFCCNPKLCRRLYRITSPTLVIWGDDDRIVPIAHGYRYDDSIQNSLLKVIENCGHAPLSERPEDTVSAIIDFLSFPS